MNHTVPRPLSNKLYLANINNLTYSTPEDVNTYSTFYRRFLNHNVALVDRCAKISMPYNFELYEKFKMPTDLTNFNMSYEDCCMQRAEELINLSKQLNKPIVIMYSGGIDSTLVVISFLKILEKENIRDRIIIAMSPESINENPNFYYRFIINNFNLISSENFSYFFNGQYIILGGEHNDQLFGSDITQKIGLVWGFEKLFNSYKDELMYRWLLYMGLEPQHARFWFDMLVWSAETSPCQIKTSFDLFWWLNFNFKWQSVFFRILLRVNKDERKNINLEFINNYFHHFYSGINFQKWSMTHPHLKIKDTWLSYKFYVKDLIYEFTQDGIYREQKVKWGSLYKLFIAKNTPVGLTTNFEYLDVIDKDYFYNPNNSFKDGYRK